MSVLAIRANRIIGWILVGAGVFGFIHSLPGLMELTVLHNLLHLGTGAAALFATGSEAAAAATARLLGFAYLGLAVLGHIAPYLFPNHLPLTPFDTFLHWSFTAAFLFAGFMAAPRHKVR